MSGAPRREDEDGAQPLDLRRYSREALELTCPGRVGVGSCLSGCWEEPRCITDEPLHGWRWRTREGRLAPTPPDAAVVATARARWEERRRWLGEAAEPLF